MFQIGIRSRYDGAAAVQCRRFGRTLLLSIVDATERQKREAEKDLLFGEIRHRMKNLLAVIQGMARQTAVEGRSGQEYRDTFLGRFNALVAAQDIAFSENGEIELQELLERTLEPYAADPKVIAIEEGPTVALAPGQIMPVSLILHELATNAVKHGALSMPQGQIRIHWDVEEENGRRVRLLWHERGPRVRPPAAPGFGTHLIEFTITRELGGRMELNYLPAGLKLEIVFP